MHLPWRFGRPPRSSPPRLTRLTRWTGAVVLCACSGIAAAAEYLLPPGEDSVIGWVEHIPAQQKDTLVDIGRRYNLGYEEMRLANPGVDTWLPGAGREITLPRSFILPHAPREGIVLNLAEMRLYYYPKPRGDEPPRVVTYPVSVGRMDWNTPLGKTSVIRKVTDPVWYPPASIREEHAAEGDELPKRVPAGPDNPLGQYALYLGVRGYLLHGTNKPYGIGMRVTHGCLRLYPEDIEKLYRQVPVGTPVWIVDQPYKVGWSGGVLYLEAHPPFGDATLGQAQDLTPMTRAVLLATRGRPGYPVNWDRAEAMALHPDGMPEPITDVTEDHPSVATAPESRRTDKKRARLQ